MAIETTSDLSSVVSSQIVDGAITSAKIGTGAVGSAALASGAVVAASIAAGAVGSAALSSGSASSNDILIANGSGGASYSSSYVLISSTTVTSTSNTRVEFTNIPSGYKDLRLVWKKVVSTNYSHIQINADTLNHDYGGAIFGFTSTSGQAYRNSDADRIGRNANNGAFIRPASATSTLSESNGFAIFYSYTEASRKHIKWENYGDVGPTNSGINFGYAIYNSTSPITSFSIGDFFSTGTIYGEFYLYGSRV